MKRSVFIVMLLVLLSACGGGARLPATATSSPVPVSTHLTETAVPTDIPASVQTAMPPTASLAPEAWRTLPVIPVVSAEMIAVYQRGLARGRDPNRFSKIGDCQNIDPYFLAPFSDPSKYRLGDQFASLQLTIDHFAGSWSRKSLAVHGGMNVAAVQNPFWTLVPRPAECQTGETPLACEIRVNNPSIVIISMEESWSGDIVKYDRYMRLIVEYVLSQDVVPILATRAELPNPTTTINATVARIAYDYHVPIWNFWAASYPLPSHGLTADGFHLTPGTVEDEFYFDDANRMKLGWVLRNLTALQSIDAVWHGVSGGN